MFVFHDLYILEFHHTLHKTIPFCFWVYFFFSLLSLSLHFELSCALFQPQSISLLSICHESQTRITFFFIKRFEFNLNATMRHKRFDRWSRRRFTYWYENQLLCRWWCWWPSLGFIDAVQPRMYIARSSVLFALEMHSHCIILRNAGIGEAGKQGTQRERITSLAFLLFLQFQVNVFKCIQLDNSNNNGTMPTEWKCLWKKNIMCIWLSPTSSSLSSLFGIFHFISKTQVSYIFFPFCKFSQRLFLYHCKLQLLQNARTLTCLCTERERKIHELNMKYNRNIFKYLLFVYLVHLLPR